MGFCLLNHAAVAAEHARAEHGVDRISILDFDVHHGNGTQAIYQDDANVQYISSHQFPLYPGTGAASETGLGNILNMPLAPGAGSMEFRAAWYDQALPALRAFAPELIIVSAGFDAHAADSIGQLQLTEDDFEWISDLIADTCQDSCDGRLVSILEGGYHLEALAASALRHVQRLAQ